MELEKFPQAEDVKYKRIFGGVAMPSAKAAGFVVVVGETHELGFQGKPKYIFFDEAESYDGRELIERVGWFDYRYNIDRWLGDTRDVGLDTFLRGVNAELTISDAKKGRRKIEIMLPCLLLGKETDKPFAVIVPDLNRLLGGKDRNSDRRRLFLKEGSRLMAYVRVPQPGDAVSMTFDDYPAISALAFCVSELERPPQRSKQEDVISEYDRI